MLTLFNKVTVICTNISMLPFCLSSILKNITFSL